MVTNGKYKFMLKIKDQVSEEDKKQLKVLDDNETRRDRIWKDCVEEAKKLVFLSDNLRMKIADLAIKCCVLHHGGKSNNSRYTATRFAEEIGVNVRTLLEWIHFKKNIYDPLPEKEKELLSFQDLRYLDTQTSGLVRTSIEKQKAVLKKLAEMKKMHPDTVKFMKYVKHLKTIRFNTKHKQMIKHVDRTVLSECLMLTRQIVNDIKFVDTEVVLREK